MKRQYTSKRFPCPICNKTHGCAIKEDSLIECLRSFSQHDAPAGYRFIALLRNDMGGLFALEDSNAYLTTENKLNTRRQHYVKQKNLLSISERDRDFRSILQECTKTLSFQHSSHLHEDRQLTIEEINWLETLGWLRTWKPGTYAPDGIKSTLPGISSEGKLLGMPGFAITALSPDGHITGMQIATLRTKPKYVWLSSNKDGGNGPQLPNGELPLFCWKHPDAKKIKTVILCEGALKSLLVAMFLWRQGRTDIAVIGTAGAARYGKKTLKDYLKRLRVKEVRLMPDAGAIDNSLITKANEATIYSCQKWRYRISVGCWGQWHDKKHLDIDELLANGRQNEIQLQTSGMFLLKCHQANQIRKLLKLNCFHQIADTKVELRPEPDAINNSKQIHLYYQNIQTFRKSNYEVVVTWEDTNLRPEDFFALCPESIQKRLARSEREWGMLYKLKLWLRRTIERYRPKKGFGESPTKKETNKAKNIPKFINYKPGKLPKIGVCVRPPKIIFKQGQRWQVLTEAIAAGWKHILDKSPTGTFKSHDAGLAAPIAFGVERLWYFTNHARNITTQTVEQNYAYMNVRNDGMVWDTTPGGKKYLRWPIQGEKASTPGNCHRSKIFAIAREKNIDMDGIENPVCATCHLREACSSTYGKGFGHRSLRKETFKRDRIRAHPDSAPTIEDYEWKNCGNFWDEVMQTVQPINSVAAQLSDIDQVIAELAVYYPKVNAQLINLWMILRQCLNGEIKQPFHGWNDAAVRELLPEPPDNLDEIISIATETLYPNLVEILNTTSEYGSNLADLPSKMRKRFGNKTWEVIEKFKQDIILNWFIPFLQVWGKQRNGALRIEKGKLFIYTRNERHSQVAASSAWNVYLDATTTAEYLSWWINIEECEILTVEQEVPSAQNLEIVQIIGLGHLGKERSKLSQTRVAALKQELQQRHSNIKFIDWKCQTESEDGAWFVDSRGSNDFCGVSALASIGIPFCNLGYLEVLYITLTGRSIKPGKAKVKIPIEIKQSVGEENDDIPYFERTVSNDPNFQAFVHWSTSSEIYQAFGRLRSHLRLEQKLTFYFIGDYPLEIPVKVVKACDITIEAGSRWEQTWFKIASAAKQLVEEGVTQLHGINTLIAQKVGCSMGLISKDYREALDKLLQSLLNPFNTTCKNSQSEDNLEAEARSVGSSLMPVVAQSNPFEILSELFSWQRCVDNDYWRWILSGTSTNTQIKIISSLLSILPSAWVCELASNILIE